MVDILYDHARAQALRVLHHIGTACNKQSRTFADLAEKLRMVSSLIRQVNGKAAPSRALVKGLARELDISEQYLDSWRKR
jgi:ribosome-binding protein aMBF1 (putative translation factor)